MLSYQLKFENETEKEQFVIEEDRKFTNRLVEICNSIADDYFDKKVITLCGPSCSGKTTAAEKMIEAFSKRGKEVIAISFDDFFKDAPTFGEYNQEKPDFDSVNALDLVELERCVKSLLENKETKLPIFDFSHRGRNGYRIEKPKENTILLFEGIQGMYREVVSLFPREENLMIYISPSKLQSVNGITFTADEIRLCRRLVRDMAKRGSDPDFVMYLWDSVRENEKLNIDPYIGSADYTIEANFPYEFGILKSALLACLCLIPNDSDRKYKADYLKSKFDTIPEISPEYLPDDSVYHEFIDKTIDERIKSQFNRGNAI